jgi:hypothetical protein
MHITFEHRIYGKKTAERLQIDDCFANEQNLDSHIAFLVTFRKSCGINSSAILPLGELQAAFFRFALVQKVLSAKAQTVVSKTAIVFPK